MVREPRVRPHAVVFDCDGTLADTESVSERAWEEVLARRGYRVTPEDHDAIIG
ncbi:MAG: Haloacid dehalogenase-like hydrolase, partial [Actinomycetota bacterium]